MKACTILMTISVILGFIVGVIIEFLINHLHNNYSIAGYNKKFFELSDALYSFFGDHDRSNPQFKLSQDLLLYISSQRYHLPEINKNSKGEIIFTWSRKINNRKNTFVASITNATMLIDISDGDPIRYNRITLSNHNDNQVEQYICNYNIFHNTDINEIFESIGAELTRFYNIL